MFSQIWFADMIEHHIMQRYKKEPLNSYYYATTYPDVYAAAERVFGSWKEAIEACGFDYESIRKYKVWSRRGVIEEIRIRHKAGEPIHSNHMQTNDKSLYMAAVKRFGNWGRAVEAAGINYRGVRLRRSMTREEVRRQIIELFRNKVDLSYMNMRGNYQYLMVAGMKKLGNGSWAKARKQCGILTNYRLPDEKRRVAMAR